MADKNKENWKGILKTFAMYKYRKRRKRTDNIIGIAFILVIVTSKITGDKFDVFEKLPDLVKIKIPLCIFFFAAVVLVVVGNYLRKEIRRKKYLNSTLSVIDRMDGAAFEKYLKAFFEHRGFKVSLTKTSHDFGADLILYKKNGYKDNKIELPEKSIVQVKRYKKNVGVEAVQQIVSAKAHFGAEKCVVATNRYFTSSAKELAADNNVLLLDREYFFGVDKKDA